MRLIDAAIQNAGTGASDEQVVCEAFKLAIRAYKAEGLLSKFRKLLPEIRALIDEKTPAGRPIVEDAQQLKVSNSIPGEMFTIDFSNYGTREPSVLDALMIVENFLSQPCFVGTPNGGRPNINWLREIVGWLHEKGHKPTSIHKTLDNNCPQELIDLTKMTFWSIKDSFAYNNINNLLRKKHPHFLQ